MKTIKLKGQEYPISFGLSTFRDFKKETSQDIIKGEAVLGVDEIIKLFYSAMKNGSRLNGKSFDMTEDQVCDLFESFEQVTEMLNQFTDSMPKVEVENGQAEKKVIQMKSPAH